MTTITNERALLERVRNALESSSPIKLTQASITEHEFVIRILRAALAAPATAPDDQLLKDAERYRWCVDNNLVLAGGTREFGWQIAPVGREWNRFIDAAMKGTP